VIPYKYFAVPTNFSEDAVRPAYRNQARRSLSTVIVDVSHPARRVAKIRRDSSGELESAIGGPAGDWMAGWSGGLGRGAFDPPRWAGEAGQKGSSLTFQTHYTTNGEAGTDRPSID
jgi:hypothetical protein